MLLMGSKNINLLLFFFAILFNLTLNLFENTLFYYFIHIIFNLNEKKNIILRS